MPKMRFCESFGFEIVYFGQRNGCHFQFRWIPVVKCKASEILHIFGFGASDYIAIIIAKTVRKFWGGCLRVIHLHTYIDVSLCASLYKYVLYLNIILRRMKMIHIFGFSNLTEEWCGIIKAAIYNFELIFLAPYLEPVKRSGPASILFYHIHKSQHTNAPNISIVITTVIERPQERATITPPTNDHSIR